MKVSFATLVFERYSRSRALNHTASERHQQSFDAHPSDVAVDGVSPQSIKGLPVLAVHDFMIALIQNTASIFMLPRRLRSISRNALARIGVQGGRRKEVTDRLIEYAAQATSAAAIPETLAAPRPG
mgnify:FL=1